MKELIRNKKILLVDDEELNLEVLKEYLEDEFFESYTACNGQEALDVLNEHGDEVSAIVLDRMMPVMNGMEFLKKLETLEGLKNIPVVMQSAAAQQKDIREGIEAGVFYYITKPFEKELFIAILESALEYSMRNTKLKANYAEVTKSFALIENASFKINKKANVISICEFLSHAFPKAERAYFGINELLLNAHEHGNLGISYAEKKELLINKKWEEEILKREESVEYNSKFITVNYCVNDKYHEVTIEDQGDGFDYERYLDFEESRAVDPNGRGIAMAKKYSFDEIIYQEGGRKVITRTKK